jgi:uncharacterized protein YjaG (DUF416 family)
VATSKKAADTASARKNAKTTRGRPFQRGNPGRPKGSRNATTLALESLLDGQAEALTQKAVELALDGDLAAIRICLERILPPRKDRPVTFSLPQISCASDAAKASASLVAAVSSGEITPSEAVEISRLLETYVRTLEITELEQRLNKLEGIITNEAN